MGLTPLSYRIWKRYFRDDEHPLLTFEREVSAALKPSDTLLDAGCGRSAPVLVNFRGKAQRLVGVEAVPFTGKIEGLELYQCDLAQIPLQDASVDLIMCRAVVEHLTDPLTVYLEFERVLKPGGRVIFLTANRWDYVSLVASIVPNRLHPWIMSSITGREEENVFPTAYKSNTRRSIRKWAQASDLKIERFEYLGQHPCYFSFNALLYFLGTVYEKVLASRLPFLRGWIFCVLSKAA